MSETAKTVMIKSIHYVTLAISFAVILFGLCLSSYIKSVPF
ncbi:hypothetical protein [Bacillus altitudinis]|nr:hypothetical protein [Bacillus altitudinis]